VAGGTLCFVAQEFAVLDELKVLQEVRIASPCTASWEAMTGDQQVRYCDHCQLHVHNLSAMSAPQAATLVEKTEGRLCVRYDAHADGTMLTEECGGGFRATRRRFLTRLAASVFGLLGLRAFAAAGSNGSPAAPPRTLMGAPPPPPQHTMGKIAAPAARPQPRMGRAVAPVHPPAGATTGHVQPRALMGDVALPVRASSGTKPAASAHPKGPRRAQAHRRPRGAK
jgi:hypothetical protein